MRVLRCGSRAVLIEVDGHAQVLALRRSLLQEPFPGMGELVPGGRTLLVSFDPRIGSLDGLRAALVGRLLTEAPQEYRAADEAIVPVRYDGEDLDSVASILGLSPADVIRRHAAGSYTVGFCGFAPGFAYLIGLDPGLRLRRRPEPRTHVAGGSVAIADEYTGIYPRTSPGGWHIIGHTDLVIWDLESRPPARLRPGTRVMFREVAR